MPLTLTKRDKAYVRAVAHGGAHNMYKGNNLTYISSNTKGKMWLADQHARYIMLHLGSMPKSQIAKSWHTGNNFEAQDIDHAVTGEHKNSHNLGMFDFPKGTDTGLATKAFNYRYGDSVFLESTHLRVRVTMPHSRYNADQNTFARLIVFRSKEKQLHVPEDSIDHANPHYDLFMNSSGYEQGLNGYVDHQDAENYVDHTSFQNQHATSVQNLLVNKQKYVVMKDCKFNLGKDFGALAFETVLRWDWKDQMNEIPHGRSDITAAQGGDCPTKNYEWYILCLACDPNGETATQDLAIECHGTTHAKTLD